MYKRIITLSAILLLIASCVQVKQHKDYGNVTELVFPSGFSTSITSMGVYYPDGTNAQRTGVKINYRIEPSAEDMLHNRDIVMEKAMEL